MARVWMWIIGTAVVIFIGGSVLYFINRDTEDTGASQGGQQQIDAGATKEACDVFTPAVAWQVLGEGARRAELPPGADASTDEVSVTSCMYELPEEDGLRIADVLVRGAKNPEAYQTNRLGFDEVRSFGGFGSAEPVTSESIAGLGGDAYYNPAFQQVNVLIEGGQYWLIVSVDGDRAASEALARAVAGNL